AERGVRGAGARGAARVGRGRRLAEGEPERRRDRARPSAGDVRRAAGADRGQPVASRRRQARRGDDVHRRGAGHRDADRARLTRAAEVGCLAGLRLLRWIKPATFVRVATWALLGTGLKLTWDALI